MALHKKIDDGDEEVLTMRVLYPQSGNQAYPLFDFDKREGSLPIETGHSGDARGFMAFLPALKLLLVASPYEPQIYIIRFDPKIGRWYDPASIDDDGPPYALMYADHDEFDVAGLAVSLSGPRYDIQPAKRIEKFSTPLSILSISKHGYLSCGTIHLHASTETDINLVQQAYEREPLRHSISSMH